MKASWTVLEESWELLGGLEASWQRLGSHLGVFGEPSSGCLEGLGPKEKHVKGGKIYVKRPSHLDFNFGMIFDRFGILLLTPGKIFLLKIIGFVLPEGFSPFLTRNSF